MKRGPALSAPLFILLAGAVLAAGSGVPGTIYYQKTFTGALANSAEAVPLTFTFGLYDVAGGGCRLIMAQSSTGSAGSANAISVIENLNSDPSAPPPANDKVKHEPKTTHTVKRPCPYDPDANPSEEALEWARSDCSSWNRHAHRPRSSVKGTPEWMRCVDRRPQLYDCGQRLYTKKERARIAKEARLVCAAYKPPAMSQQYYDECLKEVTHRLEVRCVNTSYTVDECIDKYRWQRRRSARE